MKLILQQRENQIVFDGPRTCYNGAFGDHHYEFGPWEDLDIVTEETKEKRLKFWRETNDLAVRDRGESALRQFRIVEKERFET